MSGHCGPSSARILLSQFSQNPHYPWCFLLVSFNPLIPPTCFSSINSHLPKLYTKLGLLSHPHCKILFQCSLHHLWWFSIMSALPSLTNVSEYFFFNKTHIHTYTYMHMHKHTSFSSIDCQNSLSALDSVCFQGDSEEFPLVGPETTGATAAFYPHS